MDCIDKVADFVGTGGGEGYIRARLQSVKPSQNFSAPNRRRSFSSARLIRGSCMVTILPDAFPALNKSYDPARCWRLDSFSLTK